MSPTDSQSRPATGVSVLLLLLRYLGVAADASQLTHQYGDVIGVAEILRCARDMKLKARCIDSSWDRLSKTSLPAIAERRQLAVERASEALCERIIHAHSRCEHQSGFATAHRDPASRRNQSK